MPDSDVKIAASSRFCACPWMISAIYPGLRRRCSDNWLLLAAKPPRFRSVAATTAGLANVTIHYWQGSCRPATLAKDAASDAGYCCFIEQTQTFAFSTETGSCFPARPVCVHMVAIHHTVAACQKEKLATDVDSLRYAAMSTSASSSFTAISSRLLLSIDNPLSLSLSHG